MNRETLAIFAAYSPVFAPVQEEIRWAGKLAGAAPFTPAASDWRTRTLEPVNNFIGRGRSEGGMCTHFEDGGEGGFSADEWHEGFRRHERYFEHGKARARSSVLSR